MAKIRKLNVSEITGTSPYTGDTDAVMPSGTVVVYEKDNNGVIEHVLRVHDGVTNGGVAISPGPGPVIFNGSDGIVRDNLNEDIAAVFNNGTAYITGGNSLRFTGLDTDSGSSTSVLRFWNAEGRHSSGNDATELVTLNVGNDAANGDPTEGFFKIVTEKEVGDEKEWKFDANGVLHLPTNGDILDSNGNSVLGSGSTPNVWVQTFASEDGYPTDLVSMASSVEYDIAGNVIALFTHATGFVDNNPVSSYYSVAKFTAAGLKLWQVQLSSPSTITYTDGWGLAVDNVDNRIYVAGRVEVEGFYNQSSLVKLDSEDGSLIWSNIYDFGAESDSPVVDVDSEGNPIVVGYYSTEEDTNDGVTVTKIDRLDGSIIWSRLLDGQNDDEAYGMAVGPNNEVVAVGYMAQYDEPVSHPVTPQTGSGVNVLVINRSDLSGDTLTDTWEVAGTGITGTIGVNAINVYTGLTGTVREGSGARFDFVIAGDGSISNPVTVADGGTNYLPGHKIKISHTDIGGADANSDIILTVTGATNGVITSVAAGYFGGGAGSPNNYYGALGTNYQTGSGVTFNFFSDGESTYSALPVEITAVGANYVLDDVVTISGALLGGTSPANDMTVTVNADLGSVVAFMSFSGNQQTTTYRVRTDDEGIDFSGVGTWTLSGVVVDSTDRMLVVKYDTTGAIQWQKAIQFDEGYACSGADADIDADGNIYVCGNYEYEGNFPWDASAMNIVKFNSSGVKQWSRRVSGECEDFAASIVVGPDNNLYLSGVTSSDAEERYIMVAAKYSTSGTVIWQRLLENTTTWTFVGGWFMEQGGGSNLAVRDGYVALGGSFGNLGNSEWPTATVIQMEDDGTIFATGDWQISAATFSGTLSSDASDITVVDAGKTDSNIASGIGVNATPFDIDSTDFLIPTLYGVNGADSQLTNGAYTLNLENTGAVTLPAGGTIKEGVVTSNPTIQLTPANPDVASQKLVIKGGGAYNYTDNGININYNTNTAIVGDTITFYVYSDTYSNQTLYWWISPSGAGIGDSEYGTVVLDGATGDFSILVDSDDYEFTVRVSPEADNYDPDSMGVETGLINPDAPTFDSEHHLHLTTGNLTETSIFLGTDDQNVRTTVNGGIQITTPNDSNNVWTFDTDGTLTVPNSSIIQPTINGSLGIRAFLDAGTPVEGDLLSGGLGVNAGQVSISYMEQGTLGATRSRHQWDFHSVSGELQLATGGIRFTDDTIQTTAYTGGSGDATGVSRSDDNLVIRLTDPDTDGLELRNIFVNGNDADVASTVLSASGFIIRTNSNVSQKEWQFGNDGSTTLPGAVVKSTTAIIGADLTSNNVKFEVTQVDGFGVVTELTVTNSPNPAWVSNTSGNGLGDVDFSVTFDGSGNASVVVTSGGTGHTVGQTFQLNPDAVGATPPTPTAIDLTKSINSIGDGVYTLADGVEGQIMYLVPSASDLNSVSNVSVFVDHVRDGASQYSDVMLNPFYYYAGAEEVFTSICTLIYTQDHWQQVGGSWFLGD